MKTGKKFAIATPPILLATATIVFPVFIAQSQANDDYRDFLKTRLISDEDLQRHLKEEEAKINGGDKIINDPKSTQEQKDKAQADKTELKDRYKNLPGTPDNMLKILELAYKKKDFIKLGTIEHNFKDITAETFKGLQPGVKEEEMLGIYPVYLEKLKEVKKLADDSSSGVKVYEYMLNEYIKTIEIATKSTYKTLAHNYEDMEITKFKRLSEYISHRIVLIATGRLSTTPTPTDIRMAKIGVDVVYDHNSKDYKTIKHLLDKL